MRATVLAIFGHAYTAKVEIVLRDEVTIAHFRSGKISPVGTIRRAAGLFSGGANPC